MVGITVSELTNELACGILVEVVDKIVLDAGCETLTTTVTVASDVTVAVTAESTDDVTAVVIVVVASTYSIETADAV